jgi:glutamate-5-semialdehyde dehydrogenase
MTTETAANVETHVTADADALRAVETAARAARGAAADLADVPGERLDDALRAIADELGRQASPVLAANEADMAAARADGVAGALLDRLRLDEARLEAMAGQLRALARVSAEPSRRTVSDLPGGLRLEERRRPVGVIGANFEARPNVVVDIASQFVKSRNAGVLRTGSAAIRSAIALADEVIAPALGAAGLDPAMIQLVRVPGQASARALVSQPGLIPLVILRGSGDSTRSLAAEAARHGVRTMAHADGGAVMFVDAGADLAMAERLIEASLDRLGVCNRLNLLLVHRSLWDEMQPRIRAVLDRVGVAASLPPHSHPLGHEWALDAGREATVTIAPADGPRAAAMLANEETSGLAAAIVTQDPAAAAEFLGAYAGTGAFWNATTRLLDGFKLFSVPETGINIDAVPGPRGPVTFRDLYLRQFVVTPVTP